MSLTFVVSLVHEDMKGTVLFEGSFFAPISNNNGVRQGCVLAPALFFFSLLLSLAFSASEDKLFNLSRLRAKSKVRQLLLREMLWLPIHKKDVRGSSTTWHMLANNLALPSAWKQQQHDGSGCQLSAQHLHWRLHPWTWSRTSLNLVLQSPINLSLETHIGKLCQDYPKECGRTTSWPTDTKISLYNACVLSTLLYGSETWIALWPTRTLPQQLPSTLPAMHLEYNLVEQSIQQGCPRAGEHSKRARVAVSETPSLAWPCPAHGG